MGIIYNMPQKAGSLRQKSRGRPCPTPTSGNLRVIDR